ncbi:MAG: hypothetical protein U1D69_07640 [Polynucleobacter sp.]|nr:hypothetical protein [Polynucleobacter sp.]
MRIIFTACCTLIFLNGCVTVWGKSYNVALSNSSSIVIEYDPAVVDVPAMLNVAQNHCAQYKRDAILDSTSDGNLGIKVNTYKCEKGNDPA